MSLQRLTKVQLSDIVSLLQARFPDHGDDVFLSYGLASELLRYYMGHSWVNANVFPFEQSISAQARLGREFLKVEAEDTDDRFRHQDRVVRLAEILFNLQQVDGFEEKINDLRRGDLESIYAELECAKHIARSGLGFRFVIPTGVKGQDYDAEVLSVGESPIPIELKSKAEDTALSKKSILASLQSARKQLPASSKCIAFIKIPEAWVSQPRIVEEVETALIEFFRNTTRVIAIVFRWEEWLFLDTGQGIVMSKFRVERNERVLEDIPFLSDALNNLESPYVGVWLSLLDLAQQYSE